MLTFEETNLRPATDSLKDYLVWLKAATLAERTRQKPMATDKDAGQLGVLLNHWRSRSLLKNDQLFQLRLTEEDLSELEFSQLVTEPDEALLARFPQLPAWVLQLAQTFEIPIQPENPILPVTAKLAYPQLLGFLEIARPFIQRERSRLHVALTQLAQQYAYLPFDPATIEDLLLGHLTPLVLEMVSPTLVLELNVARLKGLLKGETSEARFNHFIALLNTAYGQAILQEYPVLARQLDASITHGVDYALEIVQHLCQDWPQLVATFSPAQNPGLLTGLSAGQGDAHRQGRTVVILEFSSGLKLVYKPRSMAVDRHFQELLAWLNQHSNGSFPAFRITEILPGDGYGWMEYIEAAPCTTPQQVEAFYQRQGAYLALLYTFGSNDFHAENIIAAGEHPILIDLETLFQPQFDKLQNGEAPDSLKQLSDHSVLKVGLLPQKVFSGKHSAGLEISGLGGQEGQTLPYPVPHWEKAGTDEMSLVLKPAIFQTAKNQPTLNGTRLNAFDYVEFLVQGFTQLYQLLSESRDELVSDGGPIQQFEHDSIRVLLRSTYFYVLLRQHSFQANNLRDGRDRDRLLDKLWNGMKNRPGQWCAVSAERADLQEGDIPFFTARISARDVYTSRAEVLPNFLNDSSITFVHRRLNQLSPADLNRQIWFIRASLTTFARSGESVSGEVYQIKDFQGDTPASREAYLAAATQVADRLVDLALQNDQDIVWMGLLQNKLDEWSLGPLGINLYDGTSGIVLFLAYLGHVTENPTYTNLAKNAWRSMRPQIDAQRTILQEIGAFGGWSSLVYTMLHLSTLWHDEALLTEAVEMAEAIQPLIAQDNTLDFISGLAGYLTVLVALYNASHEAPLLSAARACGERLLELAQPQPHGGVAWVTHMPASQPAIGLARGSTGIGLALLKLAELTGDTRFQQTGVAAITYERSFFHPEKSNWPDFRTLHKDALPEGEYRFGLAWCHGAPGIGLARLAVLPYLNTPEVREEVEAALKSTAKGGFGDNHSLCHGDLGNLDVLIQAGYQLNDPFWQAEQARIGTAILNSTKPYGWLCSTPLGIETPGFMVGLAGIGYGFLRLADPAKVPSVLSLEPPRSSR